MAALANIPFHQIKRIADAADFGNGKQVDKVALQPFEHGPPLPTRVLKSEQSAAVIALPEHLFTPLEGIPPVALGLRENGSAAKKE
jgi:hypothetical protein